MDIKFDKMTVDTSIALQYLKSNTQAYDLYKNYNTKFVKPGGFVYNGRTFQDYLEFYNTNKLVEKNFPKSKLRALASLLKKNTDLISQLEYLIRKMPIEDTKAQLDLLIKHLWYTPKTSCTASEAFVFIHPDDPLLMFGCIKQILVGPVVEFNVTKSTAVLSYLFVKLCHEAGLNTVFTQFSADPNEKSKRLSQFGKLLSSGTVGVVSEDADVDSAVDVFISSSKQAPWRLRKIFVQESVYQQFKDALSWKCKLGKQGDVVNTSKVLCSETLTYNDRVFLIDPVGVSKDQSAVSVEAYRTRKELISFLLKDETRYLSLWSNDVAEINEITHSVESPVVWVNNLGDFRGPVEIAEAIYTNIYDANSNIKKCAKITKLCELRQSWLKLDFESRRNFLYIALEKCIASAPHSKAIYTDIIDSLTECSLKNSFVEAGKDYVCVGMIKPVGIKKVYSSDPFFTVKNFKSLLYGNAFVMIYGNVKVNCTVSIELLEKCEVPVVSINDGFPPSGDFTVQNSYGPDSRTRVVWTNSGTIFAN